MMRVRLRPTRKDDVAALIDRALPHRIRAVTAVIDGEHGERVIGVGGIGYRPDGTVIAFAHMSEEMRRYPLAVHRAGRAGMKLMRESGAPIIVAEAQPGNPAAVAWLEHFGFTPLQTADGIIYVWRRA